MSGYSTFKYGAGVLYGSSAAVTSVDPETGPSVGGNTFVVVGSGFDPRQWDSYFDGVTLDAAKFIDISSGTGSSATDSPNLALASGTTAGGVGGVETVPAWTNAQAEVGIIISPIEAYPATEVELFTLSLYVDANNYAEFSIVLGTSASTLALRFKTVVAGVTTATADTTWTTGLTTLKILRWGATVYFIVNGIVIKVVEQFVAASGKFRLMSRNVAANYDATSRVEVFYFRPFVVFDDRPVHDIEVVSDYRVRGLVPPSWDAKLVEAAYAGLVDVSVVGNGLDTLADAYEYYYQDVLTVINSGQSDTKLSFTSDTTTVTPTGIDKGLGDQI